MGFRVFRGDSLRFLRVRPRFIVLAAVTIVLGVACALTAEPKPQPLPDHPFNVDWRSRLERELEQRCAKAQAEIEQLGHDHPWAGVYHVGDGMGFNVTMWLAPKSGCVAEWTGCMGLYGANWGPVQEASGDLVIEYERVTKPGENKSFPNRLDISCYEDRRFATSLDPECRYGPLTERSGQASVAVRRPMLLNEIAPSANGK